MSATAAVRNDGQPARDQPLSASSSSSHTLSRVLHPLQNLNFPQPSSSSRTGAAKPSRPVYFAPYPPHQQLKLDVCTPGSSSSRTAASSASHVGAADLPSPNRAAFVAQYDYVEMKLHGSRDQRDELAKKPFPGEPGVIYHSPSNPNVTYDTIFQTTHDFIDLAETIRYYPTFVDLPLELRPSKTRYDATKNSDDLMLRVRCLFCRGRFGGKNAKAIWERHVKEHWPKPDRVRDTYKEEGRRPVRHIQKRSTGSSSHGRNRSSDSAWMPTGRHVDHSDTESYTSDSSRASSVEPPSAVQVSIASPVYFSHVHQEAIRVHDDADTEDNATPAKSQAPPLPKSATRRLVRSPSPDSSEEETEQETNDTVVPPITSLGYWNIVFDRDCWSRASRICPSKPDIISSLEAAAAKLVLGTTGPAVSTTTGPTLTATSTLSTVEATESSKATTEAAATPRRQFARKRSHSQSEDSDSAEEMMQVFVSPGQKRRRVGGNSCSSSDDSNSGSSGYHSNSDRESM